MFSLTEALAWLRDMSIIAAVFIAIYLIGGYIIYRKKRHRLRAYFTEIPLGNWSGYMGAAMLFSFLGAAATHPFLDTLFRTSLFICFIMYYITDRKAKKEKEAERARNLG